jgi:hypothetical protein
MSIRSAGSGCSQYVARLRWSSWKRQMRSSGVTAPRESGSHMSQRRVHGTCLSRPFAATDLLKDGFRCSTRCCIRSRTCAENLLRLLAAPPSEKTACSIAARKASHLPAGRYAPACTGQRPTGRKWCGGILPCFRRNPKNTRRCNISASWNSIRTERRQRARQTIFHGGNDARLY